MSTGVSKTLKGKALAQSRSGVGGVGRAMQTDLCGFVSQALRAHSEPEGVPTLHHMGQCKLNQLV